MAEMDKDLNSYLLARFNKDDVLAERFWKKDPVLKKALGSMFEFPPVEELCCAWNILENYLGFKHDADEWGAIYKVLPDLSEEFEKVFAKWEQTMPSYLRLDSEDSYQHPEKNWGQMMEEKEAHRKTPLGKEQLQLAFKLEVLGYLKLLLTGLDKSVIDAMASYPACPDDPDDPDRKENHQKLIKEFIKEATKVLEA